MSSSSARGEPVSSELEVTMPERGFQGFAIGAGHWSLFQIGYGEIAR
jgi:hypothetical protein